MNYYKLEEPTLYKCSICGLLRSERIEYKTNQFGLIDKIESNAIYQPCSYCVYKIVKECEPICTRVNSYITEKDKYTKEFISNEKIKANSEIKAVYDKHVLAK